MKVLIEGDVASKLGLASHQNAVPLLRKLAVTNSSGEDLDDLTLELEPALPFAEPKTWRIDRLSASSSIALSDRDVELNEAYLSDLSESMQAGVLLRLYSSSTVIDEQRYPVELLARNEWGGASSMPELLPVFCTPNDPSVDKILKAASDVLRRAGRPDGIDGYEAKSRSRVWEIASSIWSAICGYRIRYAMPPASFEEQGQKIRTPAQILEGGVGTCLDTALLFAAALEQSGLNPILVLTKWHAFCGVWLQPQEFAQVLCEDASDVRKHVELQELLVFETTLATQSTAPRFGRAADVGKGQLADEDFIMAVDVRRARMQKLRPLSVTTHHADEIQDSEAPKLSEAFEVAPNLPDFDVDVEEPLTTSADKLELWQRKLLDLTTRNRLLHVPKNANAVRLVCPDPAGLEDILADGKVVRIVPMPELAVGGRDSEIYEARNQENLEDEAARQAMGRSELLARMDKKSLDAKLVNLYRKARSDLNEGGSNTLYLAIGFLHWKKSDHDTETYRAPLILLPVKLERRSVRSNVKITKLDDETRFNLTLLELLRHDFRLNIPQLEGELPTDESGVDVEVVFNLMRRAVRDVSGFEVIPEVVLSIFSFTKHLMWRDLVDRADKLMQNDVVRHLLEYKLGGSLYEEKGEYPAPRELDREEKPGELFIPLPVDSSQLAAVVASARGQSFVLDGPPGTGKSQTIANMIAHNLALGRRVLFVAEKMAALDVVKRRLDEKGIGEFCLELHSSKSSKVHVLNQLNDSWRSWGPAADKQWKSQAKKVREERDHLNQLVSALHKRWSNGWSIYEAIGRTVRDLTDETPRLEWSSCAAHDKEKMEQLRDIARRLDLNRAAAEGVGKRMGLLARTEWSNAWQAAVVAAARRVVDSLRACQEACNKLVQNTGLPLEVSLPVVAKLLPFVRLLPQAFGLDLRFAFSPTVKITQTAANDAISLLENYEMHEKCLSQQYKREFIGRIDIAKLRKEWVAASGKFWFFAGLAKKKVAKNLGAIAGTSGLPDVGSDLPHLESMKLISSVASHKKLYLLLAVQNVSLGTGECDGANEQRGYSECC